MDSHIHIEKDPYTIEWMNEYVKYAKQRGITEIHLLEHTHRFTEWMPLYEPARKKDPLAKKWVDDHRTIPFKEFTDFVKEAKNYDFDITVKFGLEVCYFKEKEDFIRDMLKDSGLDFAIGSVHYVFDVPYDIKGISEQMLWDKYPINDIYLEYYQRCVDCVESGLFCQLGHPDTIKMFEDYKPTIDLIPLYEKLAKSLVKCGVKGENNVGCYYRYGNKDKGLSDEILSVFLKNGVEIITASDAHKPSDVGRYIADVHNKTV